MTFGTDVVISLDKACLWPSFQPGEKDVYELWIKFDATCQCILSVPLGDFSLLTDGMSVQADDRSPFIVDVLGQTSTIEGEWLVFLVDSPAAGAYLFRFESSFSDLAVSATEITL